MSIPYVREIEFEYGACDQVSPLIRRVVCNNPGPFTFKGTGTYIVGQGEVAVIDPGPDDAAHLAAILAAVAGETVSAIVLTHNHADHSPLAGPLKAATGAAIYGCPVTSHVEDEAGAPKMEADHDVGTEPDVNLCGGGTVSGPGWTLEAIPTPGHTSNHLSYALPQENACFTGDHIMGWSTTVITPPDGDMTAYLDSLQRIRARNFATLWPTHGPPIRDVAAFIDAYTEHRKERLDQILLALSRGPASIRQLVPDLYRDVDPRLHPAAARSMLAGIIHLERGGEIEASGPPGPDTVYRLA